MKTLLTSQRRDKNEAEICAAIRAAGGMYIYLDKSAGFDALVIDGTNVYMVEIKRPGEKLTKRETEMMTAIEKHGMQLHILRNVDEALRMLGSVGRSGT